MRATLCATRLPTLPTPTPQTVQPTPAMPQPTTSPRGLLGWWWAPATQHELTVKQWEYKGREGGS